MTHTEGKSQTDKILNFLLAGNKITAIEALEKFKCFRLASRIVEIKQNYKVQKEMILTKTSKKRVARYSIPV